MPHPPEDGVEGYTYHRPSTPEEELKKAQSKSAPVTPEKEHDDVMRRQKSVPNDARPTTPSDFCKKPENLSDTSNTSESKEYRRPKSKTKSRHTKHCKLYLIIYYYSRVNY